MNTGSLDADEEDTRIWDAESDAKYQALLEGMVRPRVKVKGLASNATTRDIEDMLKRRFQVRKSALNEEELEGMMGVAYRILCRARPQVEGFLGGILLSRPSFEDWMTVTKEPDLRWIVLIRTAMELAWFRPQSDQDTPFALFAIWDQRLDDRPSAEDRQRLLNMANDPVLDILVTAPRVNDTVTPWKACDAIVTAALLRDHPPLMTFLVAHGYVHERNTLTTLYAAIHQGNLGLVMMLCSRARLTRDQMTQVLELARLSKFQDVYVYLQQRFAL